MQIVTPQTPAQFEACYDLRWRILRAPWQQPHGSERDALESEATHRMIVNDAGQVIAVGRLHRLDNNNGQLRYMAVDPDYRGQGLGEQILLALENAAMEQGLRRLLLHAREPVVGFYQQHGYQLLGRSHTLFGEIVHYEMSKTLGPSYKDSPPRHEDTKSS
ncbi:GNAT family N-acetyltransferase [Thiohalophilus sp.]|uniref:GNAT family N-acetyltransferase n=1 Tax=Thiohalophilus sp. TaxID=3028392 RepID=UPI002ACE06EA|nr:GNAT family N-acetyltransferase [Thiohalophilus sp.]MDZ7662886.1 GNAT family N-acetyltransferase [Thiohalophilus sp.]